jgi:GT2 family glycosyltransferase
LISVSIIIVNYNTFDLTLRCIRSVLEKTGREISYEIILVDNCSSECDPDVFLTHFPQIKLVKNKTNLGFAKGNNEGVRHATGEVILLLNSDTELVNDAIRYAYQYLISNDEVGVVSGQLIYPDGRLQPVIGRFPSIRRELFELLRINKRMTQAERSDYYLGTEFDYQSDKEADWVWGAFFMFRRADLNQFPGARLQDNFFMYYEDVQWCYFFKTHVKKRIMFIKEPIVIHYIGGSDKEKKSDTEKYATTILPNEYAWMSEVHGVLYTKLYYLLKSLHYFSLRRKEDFASGKMYLKLVFKLS